MNQENRIYTSKLISIKQYPGNIKDSNHGNGTQPNKDFKVFKTHQVNDQLIDLIDMLIDMLGKCQYTMNFLYFL